MNPLVPTGWDVAFGVATLVAASLAVIALISVLRSHNNGRVILPWTLFVLLVPVVGPVSWLVAARRHRRQGRRTSASDSRTASRSPA